MTMDIQQLCDQTIFMGISRCMGIAGALLLFFLGIIITVSAPRLFYCFFCIVWKHCSLYVWTLA